MTASVDSTLSNAVTRCIKRTIEALSSAADEHGEVKEDTTLQKAFHEAGQTLPLIQQALEESRAELQGVTQKTLESLQECYAKADICKAIFLAVAGAQPEKRQEAYKEAVQKRSKGRTVEQLVIGIATDVCGLGEILAIQKHVEGLRGAIDRLSNMEPSLPKAKTDGVFNHYGSGDQLNAPGGTVNKSTGSGNHFPGGSFFGSMTFGNNPS
ncbi:hypothetical protein NCS57_00346500 [Fusarium keratoplasticum]|uniref:Uncharacterized protein n=1 Tax=Fusarium keratoplasticum TaxID=1328300 RepID=A0ACC0R688_9HYPO|nr:hypothetical protein NCS57_00346500 [Fusarium keratoplasticum]KAI8674486.1 hypothetical protein NCS57_00346500 [Fusarium keratoplasticum]